jgi:SAM-dependent methyltransferase
MKLYHELAEWWPLVSAPEEYAEEAAIYTRLLGGARDVLELGSGGGNNASHMKQHMRLTLVDASSDMLRISQALNPECEHIEGDMRNVRLGRTFDAVFVHDAVMYLTTAEDLKLAIQTAFVHTAPGGIALFVPDCVRETFREGCETGGHDGDRKALRYLEWSYDPDPSDSVFITEYAIVLREGQSTTCVLDSHPSGLFSGSEWTSWIREAGFDVTRVPDHIEHEVFLARRPLH